MAIMMQNTGNAREMHTVEMDRARHITEVDRVQHTTILTRDSRQEVITPAISKVIITRQETGMDAEWFSLTAQGMHQVMTNGTGRWYNIDSLQMCGKTGTAQNPHGKDHAIFIGFAPMDNPKIAVAVVVENAGFGSTWAAPIASLMMEQYLTGTVTRKHIYDKMVNAILTHPSSE